MASTNFTDNVTNVVASWLNDVNKSAYNSVSGVAGSVPRNSWDKNAEHVSVKDFGAKGDGVTDDTAFIVAALASNRVLYFPAGTYMVSSRILGSNLSNISFVGDGIGATVLKATTAVMTGILAFDTCSKVSVRGITFDQNNNASFFGIRPVVLFQSCTQVVFEQSEVLRYTYIAVAVESCQKFSVDHNNFAKDGSINSLNLFVSVASSLSLSADGEISNNTSQRAGLIVQGRRIKIHRNTVDGATYGGGLGASGNAAGTYGEYVITENVFRNASGFDTDSVWCCGMEVDGTYNIVANNVCEQNAGNGISMFGYKNIVIGNICTGNGTAGGGNVFQGGISCYNLSALQGNENTFVSNHCSDIGGGTQRYGYYEQNVGAVNHYVQNNKFTGTVAGMFIQSQSGTYDTPWETYTPVATSETGTLGANSATGRWRMQGKTVFIQGRVGIVTNGTGASSILLTLPTVPGVVGSINYYGTGRDDSVTAKQLTAKFLSGTSTVRLTFYDGTYPGANGVTLEYSGFYEVP